MAKRTLKDWLVPIREATADVRTVLPDLRTDPGPCRMTSNVIPSYWSPEAVTSISVCVETSRSGGKKPWTKGLFGAV
eukprot:749483-Rhodomonas_salina.1